ncbi:hypothetical protein LHYA1_G008860 [Lachnellula hyalina]|uniref:DUF3295 domain-containing protein n=1 Tax=Lachnellula hyalina TaxID=1316788 RepID=A0A8H8TVS2_9HELO|nr:uncharacterized protein LHYA1_G008860 [Lachnellula hyalina]TVY22540.1 hypothetical protein LHYA1_G008860 [Lachnellula hyalina]
MESFYTLSSEGDTSVRNIFSSFRNEELANTGKDRTTLTTPSPITHDTSRASYHISDISSFAENLQDAANRAFPNRGRSRYKTVNVCLIRWQEDELEVKSELERLYHVFDKLYGFNTQIWLIPPRASQIQLTSMTCSFLQEFDDEDNLFIVYYGGHGTINQSRQSQWWCSRSPGSPFVDWSAIQALFSTALSDVLVLLDCCAAASSAQSSGKNVMEAIAACGFETRAPPPGIYSFTNTLIEVLEDWVNKLSFSAAMLHTEILFVLKQKRPERGRDGRRLEWCSTPIHLVYTSNPKSPGVELCCLKSAKSAQKAKAGPVSQTPNRSTSYVDSMDLDDDGLSEALSACQDSGKYQIPHVLISIALEEEQADLDASSCRRWLSNFPALVKYATVEGVYRGNSTLITMSLPVMIWDCLPNNPACSFIGFVNTPNRYSQSFCRSDIMVVPEQEPTISSRRIPARSKLVENSKLGWDSSYGSDSPPSAGPVVPGSNFSPKNFGSKRPTRKNIKATNFALGGSTGSESDLGELSASKKHVPFKQAIRANAFREDIIADEELFEDGSESYEDIIDGEESSDWEDPIDESKDLNTNDKSFFRRLDSGANRSSPKSLISTMLHRDGRARAFTNPDPADVAEKVPSGSQPINMNNKKSRGHQTAYSPRKSRRNMIATELTPSLRLHLLWEHKQNSRTEKGMLKRRHSDVGTLKQHPEKFYISDEAIGDGGYSFLDEGSGEYHSKGW